MLCNSTDPAAIVQNWNHNAIAQFPQVPAQLFPGQPRIGVVVGTFAAIPYVHLQLEARRRFFPHVPLLVHDDASAQAGKIKELCDHYGCDFESNRERQPATLGDVSVFAGGLLWAQNRGLDLLVKVSRRWVFRVDWTSSLAALAQESQYATYCSYTSTFDFGFRTECVGMSVSKWGHPEIISILLGCIREGNWIFVEEYMHQFARLFENANSLRAQEWRKSHPMTRGRTGYALWTLMGTDRLEKSPYFLWHDSSTANDYHQLALEWGLPYELQDFVDPNQGQGEKRDGDVS